MKRKYKLILVAGARPNFMKIATIVRAIRSEDKKVRTWEDGQALRIRRDQRSEVRGQRTEGQRSEVRSQRTEDKKVRG